MPNGNVVVFLEGLQRIRITELLGLRPFLRASIESEPDILGDDDNELEALERNAQDLFRDVVSHSPQLFRRPAKCRDEYRRPQAACPTSLPEHYQAFPPCCARS